MLLAVQVRGVVPRRGPETVGRAHSPAADRHGMSRFHVMHGCVPYQLSSLGNSIYKVEQFDLQRRIPFYNMGRSVNVFVECVSYGRYSELRREVQLAFVSDESSSDNRMKISIDRLIISSR
jgi:hypothetical protein